MSKIAVVYWSGTGNTEAMAHAVADGARSAGAEVEEIQAADFSEDAVTAYDAIAFGCPAMGSEILEEIEFEPMFESIETALNGKKIGLFGSYDWGTGEWMDIWKERAEADGAQVVNCVIANLAPDDEALEACKALGASLV